MKKLFIILGSTREGRQGEKIAKWAYGLAGGQKEFETELIDLRDWPLPFFNSPVSPSMAKEYDNEPARKWAAKIAQADGFIIVTPEYNHSFPAVLKGALEHLFKEWNRKPVAFVSYGWSAAGARAVEQLINVVIDLKMIPIREQINISIPGVMNEKGEFIFSDYLAKQLENVFGELAKRMARDISE